LLQHHPFVDDGLGYNDIKMLLENSGIGFPDYYEWRSRSGCYFCFYQTKREWISLYRRYPDLFFSAAEMEKTNEQTGKRYLWNEGISLRELIDKAEEIESNSLDFIHGLDKNPKLLSLLESVNETIESLKPHDFLKEFIE